MQAGSWLVNAARIDAEVQIFQLGRQTRIRVKRVNAQIALIKSFARNALNAPDAQFASFARTWRANEANSRLPRRAKRLIRAAGIFYARNASLHWLNIEMTRTWRAKRVRCERTIREKFYPTQLSANIRLFFHLEAYFTHWIAW